MYSWVFLVSTHARGARSASCLCLVRSPFTLPLAVLVASSAASTSALLSFSSSRPRDNSRSSSVDTRDSAARRASCTHVHAPACVCVCVCKHRHCHRWQRSVGSPVFGRRRHPVRYAGSRSPPLSPHPICSSRPTSIPSHPTLEPPHAAGCCWRRLRRGASHKTWHPPFHRSRASPKTADCCVSKTFRVGTVVYGTHMLPYRSRHAHANDIATHPQ